MSVQDGEYGFDNDINALVEALKGNGVISGLSVGPRSPADMYVRIAVGDAVVNGTYVRKTSTTDVLLTADGSNPRKAIISMNSAGTISATHGTAEAAVPSGQTKRQTYKPIPPNIPANEILLAEVWIPASATQITATEISDRRVIRNAKRIIHSFDFASWAALENSVIYSSKHADLTPAQVVVWNSVLEAIAFRVGIGHTSSLLWIEYTHSYRLPDDFHSWRETNAIKIIGRLQVSSPANMKITITPYGTDGQAETAKTDETSGSSSKNYDITFNRADLIKTYAAGSNIKIVFRFDLTSLGSIAYGFLDKLILQMI